MKTILLLLLCSACSLFGQGFTHGDPTWPWAYVSAAGAAPPATPPYPDVWYVSTNGLTSYVNNANETTWADNTGGGKDLTRDAVYSGFGTYSSAEGTIYFGAAGLMSNNYAMSEPYTIIKVFKMDAPGGQYNVPDMLSLVGGNRYTRYDNSSKKMEMVAGNVLTPSLPMDMISKKIMMTTIWDGTHSMLRVNRFPFIINGDPAASAGTTPMKIGGTGAFSVAFWGWHYEIKAWARLLSSNELFLAELDMGRPHGLAADLGTWNPTTNADTLAVYDIANITATNGEVITSIPDSGPYGYHMRTTNSPRYYLDQRTNDYQPHIAFNIFGMANQMAGTNFTTVYPQPTTIFLVMDSTALGSVEGSYDFIVDNCTTPGGSIGPQDLYKYNVAGVMDGGGTAIFNGENGFNGLRVYEIYYNGASSYLKTNNVTALSGNPGTQGRVGIAIAGARLWDNAYMSPMNFYFAGFYTNTLSSTTHSNILFYIKHRFKLPLTPS